MNPELRALHDAVEGQHPQPALRIAAQSLDGLDLGGRGVVLVLGVTVTAVSFVALLGLLAAYFFSWPAVPALYALAMFGLPVGFSLMLLHVVLGAVRRSRL